MPIPPFSPPLSLALRACSLFLRGSTAKLARSTAHVLVALLAACSSSSASDPDGSTPTCEQTIQRWGEEVSDVQRDLDRSCTSDRDCGTLSTDLACDEGAFVGGCPIAIVEARRAEAEATLFGAGSRACAEADPSCRSTPLCLLVDAACVEGVCTMR